MKFCLIVSNKGDDVGTWRETFEKHEIETLEQAQGWAVRIMEYFNSTLRPGEKERVLHGVEEIEVTAAVDVATQHHYLKINLVTLLDPRRGGYDRVECRHCGCTARRYGLTGIVRQTPYRSYKWNKCPGEAGRK